MRLLFVFILISTTASATEGALGNQRPRGNCVWDETKKGYNCQGKRFWKKGPASPPAAPR